MTVAAASGVLGLATGVATVALHATWWGLLLGLVASFSTLLALPPRWFTRPTFGGGWVVPVALGAGRRPEGDYLIAADPAGYLLLAATLALIVMAVLGAATARRSEKRPQVAGNPRIAG